MDIIDQLHRLSGNLWWTWQPDVVALFRDIDAEAWRQCNHNPVAFLDRLEKHQVEAAVRDKALEARVHQAFNRLNAYCSDTTTWGRLYAGSLEARPVALFSAEFGLHESIPIYSGGLGVLAGDLLATASDYGLSMVGVGLFYARGYFNQTLDQNGRQQEHHRNIDLDRLPLKPMKDDDGQPISVVVEIDGRKVHAVIWRARVGRSTLILLDCDTPKNDPDARELTNQLYHADEGVRIRQEIILGIGGWRALKKLNIDPSVVHLNEGHSAFVLLERMAEEMRVNAVGLAEAQHRIRAGTLFTTHTPVPAGHDRFSREQMESSLHPIRETLQLKPEQLMAMGQSNPDDRDAPFCMTTFAMRYSRATNAVSALHAETARKMWHHLWPERSEQEVPIHSITNGVHTASWLAPPLNDFYNDVLGSNWKEHQCDPATWQPLQQIDHEQLWELHQLLKSRLIAAVHRWIEYQEKRRGDDRSLLETTRDRLKHNVLTVAFARRFASYKRAGLLLSDEKRLAGLIGDSEKPVHFLFAGKAHPQDEEGKQIIQRIFSLSRKEPFKGRLLFIEDYDINTARHLVQGCDLWLNTPLRTFEACGTSGMKALFNGAVNLSTPDGWWAEAYDGTNGFTIGSGPRHADPEVQRKRDAAALYETLENEVIPAYYDQTVSTHPERWLQIMKNALTTLAWRYNSDRMLVEYAREGYLPAAGIQWFEDGPATHRRPNSPPQTLHKS
jgi:starch phosphorylase